MGKIREISNSNFKEMWMKKIITEGETEKIKDNEN